MSAFNTIADWYQSLKINQWDRPNLAALQQQRFRHLLQHAVIHSEFYRELYKGVDIENCRLQDLPTVTKSTMMDNYEHLVTDKRLKLVEIRSWLSEEKTKVNFILRNLPLF